MKNGFFIKNKIVHLTKDKKIEACDKIHCIQSALTSFDCVFKRIDNEDTTTFIIPVITTLIDCFLIPVKLQHKFDIEQSYKYDYTGHILDSEDNIGVNISNDKKFLDEFDDFDSILNNYNLSVSSEGLGYYILNILDFYVKDSCVSNIKNENMDLCKTLALEDITNYEILNIQYSVDSLKNYGYKADFQDLGQTANAYIPYVELGETIYMFKDNDRFDDTFTCTYTDIPLYLASDIIVDISNKGLHDFDDLYGLGETITGIKIIKGA